MNQNNLHIRAGAAIAVSLLEAWLAEPEGTTRKHINAEVIAAEANGWTTLYLDMDYLPTEEWLELGRDVDIFYESYSTSLLMGEVVCVTSGVLVRHFLDDKESVDAQIDQGSLPSEVATALTTWTAVWEYLDDQRWIVDASELLAT